MKTKILTGSTLSLIYLFTNLAWANEFDADQAMAKLTKTVQQSIQQSNKRDIQANLEAQLLAVSALKQSQLLLARLASERANEEEQYVN